MTTTAGTTPPGPNGPAQPSPATTAAASATGRPHRSRTWGQSTLAMLASAASGLLLALAFPPAMIWPLAFTALVPWLLALPRLSAGSAVLSTFLVAGVWFGISLGWVANLSSEAFPLVVLALAVHLLIFSLPARLLLRTGTWWGLAGTGGMWILFESLRTQLDLPLPFPWLMLGDSQVPFLPVVQIAELGGVALVSALVVTINLALARPLLAKHNQPRPRMGSPALAKRTFTSAATSLALLAVAVVYGFVRMEQFRAPDGESLIAGPRVTVAQPNRKHRPDGERRESALRRSINLAPKAYATRPDLLVWSEAVFTGFHERAVIDGPPEVMSDSQAVQQLLGAAVWPRVHAALAEAAAEAAMRDGGEGERESLRLIPNGPPAAWPYLVLGTAFLTTQPHPLVSGQNYDRGSAHFAGPDGALLGLYHKQKLVPMGEYVPFLELGFIGDLVRQGFASHGLGDHLPVCLPGDGPEHFVLDMARLPHSKTPPNPFDPHGHYVFATPICYELAFPHTVRQLVVGPAGSERPADFLVNLSDESWYQQSPELLQMLHMGVLRAIENRRTIVRGTNTGISAFIGPSGKYYDVLADRRGSAIEVGPDVLANHAWVSNARTPYQMLGDWVPVVALLIALGSLGALVATGRRSRTQTQAKAQGAAGSEREPAADSTDA